MHGPVCSYETFLLETLLLLSDVARHTLCGAHDKTTPKDKNRARLLIFCQYVDNVNNEVVIMPSQWVFGELVKLFGLLPLNASCVSLLEPASPWGSEPGVHV